MQEKYTSQQIINIISKQIKEGSIKHDEKLPTERELMEKFNVSRSTIRNVISKMISQRLLYRIADVGVFVEKEIIRKTNQVMGFTQLVLESNKTPKTKVLRFEKIVGEAKVLEAMGLTIGTKLYLLERVRYVDEKPFLYEYVYIDPQKAVDLDQYDLQTNSLYDILNKHYNIKINYLKEIVSAVTVDGKISDFLYQTSTAYALKVEGLSYDINNEVIEYGVSYYHAENFSFESVLVNRQ